MKKIALSVLFCIFGIAVVEAQEAADLGQIVVTPNRYVQDAAEAPSYVKVITSSDIAHSGAFSVPELLSKETGVHVYNKGSLKTTVLDMGGYNDAAVSDVLVLLNGRRINPSDSSGPDLAAIPLDAVERIEIMRGGASVLYGDNAVGGVVNIITKKGKEGVFGSVATEAGSYGRRKEALELSAGHKDVAVYAFASKQDTQGYRANNAFHAGDGQVRVDWKAAPLLSLGLETGWHEDHYGTPSGLSFAQMALLGRRGSRTPDDNAFTRDRFLRFISEWTPLDVDGHYGTVSVDYTHRDRDIYADVPSYFETTKTSTLNDSANFKYKIDGEMLGKKAGLITGVDFTSDRSHTLDDSFGFLQDILIAKKEEGYYARAEYELLDRLTADFGGRFEKAVYTFNNRAALTKSVLEPQETLWGGGLKYDYAPGSNVFIRADETFRFLNTDEWFSRWSMPPLNLTLKQQTGIDYRMGIKHVFGEIAEASVTPFLAQNRNEIFLDPTVFPGNNRNYGNTQRLGADVGAIFHLSPLVKAAWLKAADVDVNYTYLNAEFRGGTFTGRTVPMVPEHQFGVGFNAMTRAGFSWKADVRLTGVQYGISDDANTKPRMNPSTVVDTRLGYQFKDAWETFVGINNLFNERYYDYLVYGTGASTGVDYYPAMDRNFVAGLKYKF